MSKVQVDTIVNKTDTGAPTCTKGLIVTGIITATSYRGDGSQLTGVTAGISSSRITGLSFFFGY